MFDAVTSAADFGGLASATLSSIAGDVGGTQALSDGTGIIFVRAGDDQSVRRSLTDWLSSDHFEELWLIDPYFRPDDFLIFRETTMSSVHVLTGNSVRQGLLRDADDVASDITERWRLHVDSDPPSTLITVLGTQSGKCPIHDRFLLSSRGGLQFGTSVGGFASRDSTISQLGPEEADRIRAESFRWLIAGVPILEGERVSISSRTIP